MKVGAPEATLNPKCDVQPGKFAQDNKLRRTASRFHVDRLSQTLWRAVAVHLRRIPQPQARRFRISGECLSRRPARSDSEGLLLLSDEAPLNARLLHPRNAHEREYWVQVERIPDPDALRRLERGVMIAGRRTLPCRAWILDPEPGLPPREPPVRFRKTVPTCWIAVELVEGKNRQVRRMTAAIGHPTLRLVRVRIGRYTLGSLPAGTGRSLRRRNARWRWLDQNVSFQQDIPATRSAPTMTSKGPTR